MDSNMQQTMEQARGVPQEHHCVTAAHACIVHHIGLGLCEQPATYSSSTELLAQSVECSCKWRVMKNTGEGAHDRVAHSSKRCVHMGANKRHILLYVTNLCWIHCKELDTLQRTQQG